MKYLVFTLLVGIAGSVSVAALPASKNATLTVTGCIENRSAKELLEFGKIRAQEQYSIEDPDRFIEYKNLANRLIAELDAAYDKECRMK